MNILSVTLLCVIAATTVATVNGNNLGFVNEQKTNIGFTNGRVVGGREAERHSAPWIITMQWGIILGQHLCGGSIISNEWIVTAGHCLHAVPAIGLFNVIAGRHSLVGNEQTEQRRSVNRARTWIHELYVGGVAPHDIALIQVSPGFEFNAFVRPITLPTQSSEHTGDVTLWGWGSTSTTEVPTRPIRLQTVDKPIITLELCKIAFWATINETVPLHENNVCTGPLTGGISACSGDSGGPIAQNGTLIGIASWTVIPCGQPNAPTVYVKVSAYIDWINNILRLNSN